MATVPAYPGAPTPTADKHCWINVWPGPAVENGFLAPGHHTLYLPLNPDIQFSRAIRTTPTQTIAGAWVDNFGLGIGTLTLSTHTGWAAGAGAYNGRPVNGLEAWQHLWWNIMEYYFAEQSKQATQTPQVTMQVSSEADDLFLDVIPTNPWATTKTHTKPYLMQYQISFLVLRDNLHPGAVSPVADPIDPLIHVSATAAVSDTVVNAGGVAPPSPLEQALPGPVRQWRVRPGQTLWTIAATLLNTQNGTAIAQAVQRIAQANHLADPSFIYPPQILTIPYPL